MESYRVGSIAWSTRYFPEGQFTAKAFQMAEIAAKAVLDEAFDAYRRDRWDMAYGSAGTIGAVGDVLAAAGWPAASVSQAGLDWLLARLLEAQSADRLRLPGMKEDRRAVIGGGVSILRAIFDLLKIDEMQAATGGLRHGLLCDLVGGDNDTQDVRSASVQRLATKFNVDAVHGHRVGRVAVSLFRQLDRHAASGRPGPDEGRTTRKLQWAAQLHEIGTPISHSDYHKHGAYILDNADAMGFSQAELHRLSLLVLGHRGKLRKLDANFADVGFVQQLLCLRLAVILCHARRDPMMDSISLRANSSAAQSFTLTYSASWEKAFPQSVHLLREEALAWHKTPWDFVVENGSLPD
jgi:exopolyphosphatase/guanosine-5'-triphosphate,3'-diphosphate pyrophosphatase